MSEIPISEDVARAYIDGRNEGREAERVRVRRELLAWAASAGVWPHILTEERFRAALDRICPAEPKAATEPGMFEGPTIGVGRRDK